MLRKAPAGHRNDAAPRSGSAPGPRLPGSTVPPPTAPCAVGSGKPRRTAVWPVAAPRVRGSDAAACAPCARSRPAPPAGTVAFHRREMLPVVGRARRGTITAAVAGLLQQLSDVRKDLANT